MFYYSTHSKTQRAIAHPYLQEILDRTLITDDHRYDQSGRLPGEQQRHFESGASQIPGYRDDGSVNHFPHEINEADGYAYAVDLWPYIHNQRLRIPEMKAGVWTKTQLIALTSAHCQFVWFLRKVRDEADRYFVEIEAQTGERWALQFGINWDMDAEILTDQRFDDLPHIKLIKLN